MRPAAALWVMLLLARFAAPAAAQAAGGSELRDELARIRAATDLQVHGDLAGAERGLRAVIAHNPTSLTGLLLLEQLLTQQGRTAEILPLVEELIRREPSSTLGHQLRARTYARLERFDDLEEAAGAWIAATPGLETPYREVAGLWLERKEFQRALEVLERGRSQVKTAGALALELGDAHLAAGSLERAVAEWDRAVGAGGQGFMAVQRRLRALPDGGSAAAPLLVQSLLGASASTGRRRAALQLAIDAGLGAQAARIAPLVLDEVPAAEREQFLADVARRADAAGLAKVGYWAYGELIRTSERGAERLLALRTRHAQLALAAGDSAAAAAAYRVLEQAASPGSPQRRQAIAVRIRLAAASGDAVAAAAELRSFRTEFPEAEELDETAAAVGEGLLRAGAAAEARSALAGVRGPRSALARGRLLLGEGDVSRAAAEFLAAAPGLHGSEATSAIALAAALGNLSGAAGALLGNAVSALASDPEAAVQELSEGSAALPAQERATILDFAAARTDEAGLPELSGQLRQTLLEVAPKSPAAPAALFWLARRASSRPEQRERATVLFERLIIDYPRSALVPQARRELERLSGRTAAAAGSKAGGS